MVEAGYLVLGMSGGGRLKAGREVAAGRRDAKLGASISLAIPAQGSLITQLTPLGGRWSAADGVCFSYSLRSWFSNTPPYLEEERVTTILLLIGGLRARRRIPLL